MIKIKNPAKTIDEGINNLINASNEDYNNFCDNKNMQNEFANKWDIKEGQKYIKVISKNMVHSFIVKKAFKHFKVGDVLKAASWAAPALNQPRGNVLDGNYHMQWTGPLYLN
tara:strand:- start:52 stop:387 length:336 start_codon:yes stop_codon:yes gene_type:complete